MSQLECPKASSHLARCMEGGGVGSFLMAFLICPVKFFHLRLYKKLLVIGCCVLASLWMSGVSTEAQPEGTAAFLASGDACFCMTCKGAIKGGN